MRSMVFISHANPEDNDFALWLSLKLANEGYPVWCDLTKLLGGEDFWQDIEGAIRERAVKFVFVLSRSSNHKRNPLNELHCALGETRRSGLNDFVIPVHIDDLPYEDINVQIGRLNAIPFEHGWAAGLARLLLKLEEDGIGKSSSFGPTAVTKWWRDQFSPDQGVIQGDDEYTSNWFAINGLPATVYLHEMRCSTIGLVAMPGTLNYPGYQHNQHVISFAPPEDLAGDFSGVLQLGQTRECDAQEFLEGNSRWGLDRRQSRDVMAFLLRSCWQKMCERKRMGIYAMANGILCPYFPKELVSDEKVHFTGIDGRKTWRQVMGYRTRKNQDGISVTRFWHLGMDAKPIFHPTLALLVRAHVLFSSDGSTIWDSKARLHAARRSQCKDWWNERWRDTILASMSWLANGESELLLPLASKAYARVSSRPVVFISPVHYLDPDPIGVPDELSHDEDSGWDEDDWADDREYGM